MSNYMCDYCPRKRLVNLVTINPFNLVISLANDEAERYDDDNNN